MNQKLNQHHFDMRDMFLSKLKHQGRLIYLGASMQDAIESGKLKGDKLSEAEKKQSILIEAYEFINELFYKYEEALNSAKMAGYERLKLLEKTQDLEDCENQLEAVKKAWNNE